jgi:hypothetical protein
MIDTAGTTVFTNERHPELKIGERVRVRYRLGFDKLGIAAMTIDVTPVEARKGRSAGLTTRQVALCTRAVSSL